MKTKKFLKQIEKMTDAVFENSENFNEVFVLGDKFDEIIGVYFDMDWAYLTYAGDKSRTVDLGEFLKWYKRINKE